ncbi:MAG TPA: GNAT family N-acetyltransferase [Gaiellales bacterium]|nr:GNAT family N-acetyltransferase [Gaiellales bacterium]
MTATAGRTLTTARLVLEQLRPEHAGEMVDVLADDRLYTFTGGRPPRPEHLRERYRRLAAGSPDGSETWLNWIARERGGGAVGAVQATLSGPTDRCTAHVAWVVGVPWQGRGLASEAARAVAAWLWSQGVVELLANIHPAHTASQIVAARAGLEPTGRVVDGEQVWRATGSKSPTDGTAARRR